MSKDRKTVILGVTGSIAAHKAIDLVSQLTMGFHMGLGEIREEAIEVVGEKLGTLISPWKPARLMG